MFRAPGRRAHARRRTGIVWKHRLDRPGCRGGANSRRHDRSPESRHEPGARDGDERDGRVRADQPAGRILTTAFVPRRASLVLIAVAVAPAALAAERQAASAHASAPVVRAVRTSGTIAI